MHCREPSVTPVDALGGHAHTKLCLNLERNMDIAKSGCRISHQSQETNALLKLINMGKCEIAKGKVRPLAEVRTDLDARILSRTT